MTIDKIEKSRLAEIENNVSSKERKPAEVSLEEEHSENGELGREAESPEPVLQGSARANHDRTYPSTFITGR